MSVPIDETLHKDPVLEAAAEKLQRQCVQRAAAVVEQLRAEGYDLVLVRLVKLVSNDRECAVPGASLFDADDRMMPALPREADSLRTIAADMDALFAKHGTFEAEEGYVENATARAAEFGL